MTTGKRSALVTGATRGIGRGIAERLAVDGFDLTISARDPEALEATADHLRSLGGVTVVAQAGELGEPDDIVAVVDAHRMAHGDMSVLVLNAGVGSLGKIGDIPMHRFQKLIDLNLRAPLLYLQAALPLLRAAAESDHRHGAKVIAMSSITGVYAEPQLAVYGATKAALGMLIETLNVEQGSSGITGTAIAPGYVDTDLAAWKHDDLSPDSMMPVSDVAELVGSLVALSRRTMVGQVVMARSSSDGRRA
jgi:NAD(P)-dependent dehydrogenase (short-subunit alcohol dehydrogenase family)